MTQRTEIDCRAQTRWRKGEFRAGLQHQSYLHMSEHAESRSFTSEMEKLEPREKGTSLRSHSQPVAAWDMELAAPGLPNPRS